MYYTVYKVTNKINGKFYIGKHQTLDLNDGYMGSGILIKKAIAKYGIENFDKTILGLFLTETEMNNAEKHLVELSYQSYNLVEGGQGGRSVADFGTRYLGKKHSEVTKQRIGKKSKGRKLSAEARRKIAENNVRTNTSRRRKNSLALKGKSKTQEHKVSLSNAAKSYYAANPISAERRQQMSNNRKGKAVSAETKLKIALSLKKAHAENRHAGNRFKQKIKGHEPDGKAVRLHRSIDGVQFPDDLPLNDN